MSVSFALLGGEIPVVATNTVGEAAWTISWRRIQSFAEDVNMSVAAFNAVQRAIFLLTSGVKIFTEVMFKNRLMTRSFMDLDHRIFHWHVDDLTSEGYSTPDRVASYYYHDAFHLWQRMQGDTDVSLNSMIDREVAATLAQLDVAVAMDADPGFRRFLHNYSEDRAAIEKRLRTGAGGFSILFGLKPRYEDHVPVL